MGRAPCCDKTKVKRGPWSPEEDAILRNYIEKYGTGGNWIALPRKAGLKRCGKSCRLRWSVIASHLPGRTDNDVKNHWNTKLKKKLSAAGAKRAPDCYGNSTYPIVGSDAPVQYSSMDHMVPGYSMTEVVPDLLYDSSSTDQFSLPELFEVQKNSTLQKNGFTTSSSQEISSLSPSCSLAKSYSSWNDNLFGEEVGFFMELESRSSNYNLVQSAQQEEKVRNEVEGSCLPIYSYPTASFFDQMSDNILPPQGHHQTAFPILD
ncbi:unnamed protein product [Coffea canephora]|uniref:Uncharacterized protein n=1 Tax=Coffea canephora TaxID=49390 RepID=A0A068U4L9_COFCA|nr:unnamed protein product [Coffea canephora]